MDSIEPYHPCSLEDSAKKASGRFIFLHWQRLKHFEFQLIKRGKSGLVTNERGRQVLFES
jgi:hypothetical protein